jgi:hypothetical protein
MVIKGEKSMYKQKRLSILSVAVLMLSALTFCFAQLPKIPDVDIKIPGVDKILKKDPAITSNINDAVYEVPFLDEFDPEFNSVFTDKPRTATGGIMLSPGLYESTVQSYCLKAGTHGPSKGDGYAYAPLKGQFATIVQSIIRGSVEHPEIPQRDIQVLLWAIIARTKFSDMSRDKQTTAAKLLTPKQLFEVNGGALGLVPEDKIADATSDLPSHVQQVYRAEAQLRSMLTTTDATYEQLERVAVLTGVAPVGEGSREIPQGRWSLRPEGFFTRYFVHGYSQTLVQIYVPEKFDIQRDAQGRIVSVSDRVGNKIAFEYNDDIAPAAIPGDKNIKGFAFKRILFLKRYFVVPEATLNLEVQWNDIGWTLVGIPRKKVTIGQSSEPFADLDQRYREALGHLTLLNQLDKQFKPKGSIDDIVDLAHLSMALETIASSTFETSTSWAAEHGNLIMKAWQFALAERECGINGEKSIEYISSGNTAMPGNTCRQRIETSLRPVDYKEAKEKACAKLKGELKGEEIILAAYQDMQILQMADDYGLDCVGYDRAVMNLAEWIYNSGGLDVYEPGNLSMDQLNDFFTSAPAEPGDATTQAAMSTAEDGSIWGFDGSGNEVMIISGDGTIVQNNYQQVYNQYLNKYGTIAGDALFRAGLAHEMTHHKQAKTEGFSDSPGQHRRFETAAYKAGIASKKQSIADLGCE